VDPDDAGLKCSAKASSLIMGILLTYQSFASTISTQSNNEASDYV
jgi:hypothetical protein